MVARVKTVAFSGVDVLDIDVQVQIANGLPSFSVVGLADKAVSEARERVRAALHGMGLSLPTKPITINLAPADLAKEGSHFDLPIAVGLLAAMDVIPTEDIAEFVALGVLPAAVHASAQDSPTPVCTNADADGKLLESVASPDEAGRNLLSSALDKFKLSARGYHRILRVARTCADLDGSETVCQIHIAEAISFRRNMPGAV